jgi:L-lactate dehydrogenase (cytochrome)/(S)-mandelate dehydrogenase
MKPDKALCIGDLRRLAQRRLPRLVFEVIESGVEDEHGLCRNRQAFLRHQLLARYLGDISRRDQGVELFGRRYSSPFGIGPTGFAELFRPGADSMLAQAAVRANVPFILSGASAASLESIALIAPDHAWVHLYPAKDRTITENILARAESAGFRHLVITVDNPVYPKRERDTRNGLGKPLHKLSPGLLLEALLHPGWLAGYLRSGGMPVMNSWAPFAGGAASGLDVARFFRSQSPSLQTWKDLEAIRRRWTGKFIIKGVQHPDDARRAAAMGIDGLIVSNHGGKSYDALPAALDVLPSIHAAVGGDLPVLFDSGIRRGSDVITAACLGARFTFVGRATLYGVAAAGQAGAARALDILREEVDLGLAMIGCGKFSELDRKFLFDPEKSYESRPVLSSECGGPEAPFPDTATPGSPPSGRIIQ